MFWVKSLHFALFCIRFQSQVWLFGCMKQKKNLGDIVLDYNYSIFMGGLLKDGQLCEEMVSTRSLSVHHPFGGIGGQARSTLAFSSMSPKMSFQQGIHLKMYLWGIIGKRVWQALTCFIVTVAKKWSMALWCTSSILNHVRTTDTDLLDNDMIGMEGILLTS